MLLAYVKAKLLAVPLYFQKNQTVFPSLPCNGGNRRGLVCPDNAETHFPFLFPRLAFSLRQASLFGLDKRYSFPARIFNFYSLYHMQAQKASVRAFISKINLLLCIRTTQRQSYRGRTLYSLKDRKSRRLWVFRNPTGIRKASSTRKYRHRKTAL